MLVASSSSATSRKSYATVFADTDTTCPELVGIVGWGEARCRPSDVFVESTGKLIAIGRAIADFGRQVEEMGLKESVGQDEFDRVMTAIILASVG